jgi:hypothetical protein
VQAAAYAFGHALGQRITREALKESLWRVIETAYRAAGHPYGDSPVGLVRWVGERMQLKTKAPGKPEERGH